MIRSSSRQGSCWKTGKKRRKILTLAYWQNEEMMDAIVGEAALLEWDMLDIRFVGNMPSPGYKPAGTWRPIISWSAASGRSVMFPLRRISSIPITRGFTNSGKQGSY